MLRPFNKLCIGIGAVPSAFEDSMSWYEAIKYLVDYLQKEVIPAVNADTQLVNELNDFVKHYFDNLDVQQEINNKLDAMAASGQLADMIAQYLQLAGVLAYPDLNSMKSASNLIAGSTAKTLGKTTYKDGGGSFYRIRKVKNTDVIDNDHIVALDFSDELIAEKITEAGSVKKYLFVGDSFGIGAEHSWVKTFCDLNNITLGVNGFNKCNGGAGFSVADNKYISQIQNFNDTYKNTITDIIIIGGWNDRANAATIEGDMEAFMAYAKANYPNAKVYCGMVANDGRVDDTAGSLYWRNVLTGAILREYRKITNYGGFYLYNTEEVLHNYSLISEDTIHPNNNGYVELGRAVSQAVVYGNYQTNLTPVQYASINNTTMTFGSGIDSTSNMIISYVIKDGIIYGRSVGQIKFSGASTTYKSFNLSIGTFDPASFPHFRYTNDLSGLHVTMRLKYNTDKYYMCNGLIRFMRNGQINFSASTDIDLTNISEIDVARIEPAPVLYN